MSFFTLLDKNLIIIYIFLLHAQCKMYMTTNNHNNLYIRVYRYIYIDHAYYIYLIIYGY